LAKFSHKIFIFLLTKIHLANEFLVLKFINYQYYPLLYLIFIKHRIIEFKLLLRILFFHYFEYTFNETSHLKASISTQKWSKLLQKCLIILWKKTSSKYNLILYKLIIIWMNFLYFKIYLLILYVLWNNIIVKHNQIIILLSDFKIERRNNFLKIL
jgi:hypothetical protein